MCICMSAILQISTTSSKRLKQEAVKNSILSSFLDVKSLKTTWCDAPHLLSSIS